MHENLEKINIKEDVLDSKIKMINSLVVERDLHSYFHKELNSNLGEMLKREGCEGNISLLEGLSLVEILEERVRGINERKDNITAVFDKRLDESSEIVINRDICREIGSILYNGDLPVKIEYDDSCKEPRFNFEEKVIYLPPHIVISEERRRALRIFIHELMHLIDLVNLPEDKDKLSGYLRSNFISGLRGVYEEDCLKAEKKLIDIAGKENNNNSILECRQKIKDGRLKEEDMEPALKKAYENYIGTSIMDLFSYIEYANDEYEVSADNFAKEKAPEFTEEKIKDIIEKLNKKRKKAANVSGFKNGSSFIELQKELVARTPDHLERISIRTKKSAGQHLGEVQAGKDGSRGTEAYISAIKKILKKQPIFKKITRNILESYDPEINNINISEDQLQSLVEKLCPENQIEPVNVKIDDRKETSTYRYRENTIYIPRKMFQGGDNVLFMRQLMHELGHAIDFQNLPDKKNKDRYLDSSIYSYYKNELQKKADFKEVGIKKLILENKKMFKDHIINKLPKPGNLVDILSEIDTNDKDTKKLLKIRADDYLETKLLIETLNLKYRQDYYEMKAEKFSKEQAKYLTREKLEESVGEKNE